MHVASSSGGPKVIAVATKAAISVPMTAQCRNAPVGPKSVLGPARAVSRHMIEHDEGGSLIIVSSIVSRYGGARQAAYTTTKMGLIGLGRTLAVELARYRIRCNILIPGWTETPMNEELMKNDRFMDATISRTPARRWAKPEEFHDVAAFLADPRLTFHTGNEVVVDGGYTIF